MGIKKSTMMVCVVLVFLTVESKYYYFPDRRPRLPIPCDKPRLCRRFCNGFGKNVEIECMYMAGADSGTCHCHLLDVACPVPSRPCARVCSGGFCHVGHCDCPS